MVGYIQYLLKKVFMLSALLSLFSCAHQFVEAPFYLQDVAISPDGKFLVLPMTALYLKQTRGHKSGLFLYDLEKKEFVAEYKMRAYRGIFSKGGSITHDGKKIVFAPWIDKEPESDKAIAVMNIDGSGLKYLTKLRPDVLAYYPSLSHKGDKIAYLSMELGQYSPRIGLTPRIREVRLDGTGDRELIPMDILSPPRPQYMPNDVDVSFIAGMGAIDTEAIDGKSLTENRRRIEEVYGENFLFVMGDEAGYDLKPLEVFPKEYQVQQYVVVLDNRRMIISLTGAHFNPKLILYDLVTKSSRELRHIDDEYADFDGTAMDLHPTSEKGGGSRWRFGELSHARDADKVAVAMWHVSTFETHVRILDLKDYSFEDVGVYRAWERVVSGAVIPKTIWVNE